MTNFRKSAAIGAAAVAVAVCSFAFAQDDLDDLLKDLETDLKAEKTATAKPAAEASGAEAVPAAAPEAETKAEEKPAEPVAAEQPAKPAAAEPAPAVAAAEPAKAGEPAAEEKPAAVAATPEAKAEEPSAETSAAAEAPAEEPAKAGAEKPEEPAVAAVAAETQAGEKAAGAETPAAVAEKPAAKRTGSDAELMDNIVTTERLRREAFDVQARREIDEARACMKNSEYDECAGHYNKALKLLNDRPSTKKLRRECLQGVAEALYRAALQEEALGRHEKAIEIMNKAVDMRHPKARRQLEDWVANVPKEEARDLSEVAHRRNETEYQSMREKNRQHFRRARQLLAVRDIDGALDECELVLVKDPYNQEAIRLRKAILKKRMLILESERDASHDGMIADVDKAWRPVYAPNARELESVASSTIKKPLDSTDPERAAEQTIVQRMKDMRLPTISFKPPATIIDAVEYFRGASKDFDRPDIPLEQRGFNFVLKLPEALRAQSAQAAGEESEDFGAAANEDAAAAQMGVPIIPMITASDISFYEALRLVCDSVNYKFKVQGSIVMVMDKAMTVDEMVTRSYPVLSTFMERMSTASEDMKEMKSAGFGSSSASGKKGQEEGDENQQEKWKAFFREMGVEWPEGSSLMYIKAIGKLRAKNTYENLAELEKALTELNVDQKLVEIEARFVEVSQQDLNSLGFEWILNSDYSIGMDNWLGKALNMQPGVFGDTASTQGYWGYATDPSGKGMTKQWIEGSGYLDQRESTVGSKWYRGDTGLYDQIIDSSGTVVYERNGINNLPRTMGINAFGGTSEYGNGSRYLSTEGNHISGEGKSTNDQFMRVNAFLGNADLSMILHMLSQRSDTDLLNAPKVLTKPGEEAVIKVVTEYIYPTDYDVQLQSSSSNSSGGGNGGSQAAILAVVEPSSFTMREVGVVLTATPMLTDDGNLIDLKLETQVVDEPTWKNYGMKIPFTGNASSATIDYTGILQPAVNALEVLETSLSDTTKAIFAEQIVSSATTSMENLSTASKDNMTWYEAPMEQPWFHVRSISSNVSIYPGATIVMGGLIREERKAMDDKIPFLGDLPFVGRFFRSHAEQTVKRNLLIFVTTRLVDARGREVTKELESSSEADVKAAPEKKAE